MRGQHRFGGMRDGVQNRGGMPDTRNIEGGIRDENILAGPGYAHLNCLFLILKLCTARMRNGKQWNYPNVT